MEEKTVIQNIYGTVHGPVVGGHITQPSPQPPTKAQLRAQIRQARQHKFKAQLGCYMNAPFLLMLPLLAYLLSRGLLLLQSLTQIQRSPKTLLALMVEMAVLLGVMLLLSWWHHNIRRKHSRTIQYAQLQIDQAELALQFHHHE